jgi:Ca2+:H+ antiporter
MCIFAGGMRYSEQGFSIVQAQTNSALLVVSVIAVLLLGTFDFSTNLMKPDGRRPASQYQHDVLRLSHGISVVLVIRTWVV